MSFASYTSFGTSLATWLLDSNSATITDVGVSMVADLITVGETRIFRETRTVDMETAFSDSITLKPHVYEHPEFRRDLRVLERYMKCGIGICGHCCCGDKLVCSDGPAFGLEILDNPEFCKVWRTKTGKKEPI
jgi:hypothetical protein